MRFLSINPHNNKRLAFFKQHRWKQVESKLRKAKQDFELDKKTGIANRTNKIKKLAELLRNNEETYAKIITLEMGKPIKEATVEIQKCALLCDYYAQHAAAFLADKTVDIGEETALISYEPLGIILGIMPWNFPFWQVFRFAIPNIIAGNVVLVKHAPNVPQCAIALENLFREAQFSEGAYQNIFIDHKKIRWLIANPLIQGVALTGSDAAGEKVAELAGRNIKKTVLELGGSDPFIVLSDANLKQAAKAAIQSRMLNCGQSCIAAKRFIVQQEVVEDFTHLLIKEINGLKMGDPGEKDTDIGPMARQDLRRKLAKQVKSSVRKGAKVVVGQLKESFNEGFYYRPMLLTNVKAGMPVFDEEVFGPVGAIITAKNMAEVIQLANNTPYGLGASIWTVNVDKAKRLSKQIQAGSVFINAMVKSDPRLPFGGIKRSGYGRELAENGIKEFVNIKTIFIN